MVASGETEFEIRVTLEAEITWYIIPYSDTEGQVEIPNSRSEIQTVHVLESSHITPTPTPGEKLADLNLDGEENSIDVFYFANVWYQERMGGNLPEYYDRANLVEGDTLPDPEIINEADLLVFKKAFQGRTEIEPTPTPVMPAPILQYPANNFQTTMSGHSNSTSLYGWHPLSEATEYEILIVGPSPMGTRSYTTPDTSYNTENASGQDQIAAEGTLYWKVRGLNAEGVGEWSETRIVNIVPTSYVNPADLNDDEKVNYLDIFQFSKSWLAVELVDPSYRSNADFDKNGHIEAEDLLEFHTNYRDFRITGSDCNLPAPHITYPDDNVTFTGAQVREGGIAYIEWNIVSNASGYRITFKSGNTSSIRIVNKIPYDLTESDLSDTIVTNSNPVQYTVTALCDGGVGGEPSEEMTLTIIR